MGNMGSLLVVIYTGSSRLDSTRLLLYSRMILFNSSSSSLKEENDARVLHREQTPCSAEHQSGKTNFSFLFRCSSKSGNISNSGGKTKFLIVTTSYGVVFTTLAKR